LKFIFACGRPGSGDAGISRAPRCMPPVNLVNRTEFFKQEQKGNYIFVCDRSKNPLPAFCIILTISLYIGKRRGLSKKVAEI
jgi:hypothetical protein